MARAEGRLNPSSISTKERALRSSSVLLVSSEIAMSIIIQLVRISIYGNTDCTQSPMRSRELFPILYVV